MKRLEYRGYDSCGVAVLQRGEARRVRTLSRVCSLEADALAADLDGMTGIAHTRWATHGMPVIDNAHPIFSGEQIAVVHNGIIENHEKLREQLREKGYEFQSQTDTEVIAHLIRDHYRGDILAAVRDAAGLLQGAYAIAVMCRDEPKRIVGARQGSPLVVGIGDDGAFLASDTTALAGCAGRFVYLDDDDVVDIHGADIAIQDGEGKTVSRREIEFVDRVQDSGLGAYRHYMQKEIFEQPVAVARTLATVCGDELLQEAMPSPGELADVSNLVMLGCGTSYYAALTACTWFEHFANVAARAEIASEFRYRDYVSQGNTLVIAVSQSGETADTLAALRYVQTQGEARTLAICNVAAGAMVRQSRWAFITEAGVEVGVASTKAFTTQLVALFVLADSDTGLTVGPGMRVIHMPAWRGPLSPVLHAVALQLLAYHVACLRGTDIDKPRNLAKSVTVE